MGPSPSNKKQPIVSSKDFNLVIRIIKGNWWVPFVVLPIFYLIGIFYVYRLTKVYKASTEFLIKTEDAYIENNVLSDASFYSSSFMDNSNETRIFQSYDLANEVVNRLLSRIQVSYFIVGKVRTTEQFTGMPFKVKVNTVNPELYEKVIEFKILDQEHFEIYYERDGVQIVKTGQFDKDFTDLDFKIRVERENNFSIQTLATVKEIFYQFTIHSKEHLINNIRQSIRVENPEFTQILKVELKDVIPERAILILDSMNSVYAQNKLRSKFELNERTIVYIDKQLNEITFSLKTIEDTMQNYKEKKSIINLEWQQEDFLSKISIYDAQRSQLQLQITALNDLEKYIIEDKDPQFLPPSVFIIEKGGFMTEAVQDLYKKQIELNKIYNQAREGNPLVADLKSSIKKTKQDLLTYITNARSAAAQQIESVNREIFEYIAQAKAIPGKQRELLNIQRKADVSEQLYNFLLEKRATTRIARASIVPDVKIIEAPRYVGIDSPDIDSIRRQVLSLGILVSVFIIIIRLLLFTKIKSVEHLKDLTSLPLIGVLPFVKDQDSAGIIVEESPNSSISEAFRNFRTNLQYANAEVEAKAFLVTSFLPGEGKTFTSVNLATILAKSGKKTILLELDLHKPRIYKRFGLEAPTIGITTYVTGQSSFQEVISKTQIPNLYTIYAGPIPPNPSEFVLSENLKQLIIKVKAEFDYVIIDTPPAGLLSDSVYMFQYVDASIFVLNTKSSNKKAVSFIEEVVESNNLKNVYLLLNGLVLPKKKYYYSGYGYSYGYGYGYGYGKGKNSQN